MVIEVELIWTILSAYIKDDDFITLQKTREYFTVQPHEGGVGKQMEGQASTQKVIPVGATSMRYNFGETAPRLFDMLLH